MKKKVKPCFFKVMLDNCKETLRIPPKFGLEFGRQLSGFPIVTLNGPRGSTLGVEMKEEHGKILFEHGWPEFVQHNGVKFGNFLIFRYNGKSHFDVELFEKSACQIEWISSDEDDVEESKESIAVLPPSQENQNRKKRKKISTASRRSVRVFKHSHAKGNPSRGENKLTKENEEEGKRKTNHPSATNKDKRLLTPPGSSDSDVGSTSQESRESKHELRGRKVAGTASIRKRSYCLSRRRAVTVEEKQAALKAARKFKPDGPSFLIVMLPSYVYEGGSVRIPAKFVADHMYGETRDISLLVSDGRTWSVGVAFKSCGALFGHGWKTFSFENNLEEGDVCVVEKVEQEKLHVHIFRVVEEVVPLMKVPKREPGRRGWR